MSAHLQNRQFISGGGEMGKLIRSMNWGKTPVGVPEKWPQSLRTALSMMLETHFPMYIAWGNEFTQFYNDGFRPILGSGKHPGMGKSTRETFAEIWEVIGPMFDEVMKGKAVGIKDFFLLLNRNGYTEECYFTFSYSPIRTESGEVGGVLVTCAETTETVVQERRLETLRRLAVRASTVRSVQQACHATLLSLQEDTADIPFALCYRLDEDGRSIRLAGHTGLEQHPLTGFSFIRLDDKQDSMWPLAQAIRTGKAVLVEEAQELFPALPGGASAEPAQQVYIMPVIQPGSEVPYGVLVAGLSPRKRFDENYERFFTLLADHTARAISSGLAFETRLHVEAQLRSLFNQSPFALCILRGDHFQVEMANSVYLQMVDREEKEFVGKPLFHVLPEVREVVEPLLLHVLETGEPHNGEELEVMMRRQGRLEAVYFNFVYHPLRENDDSISGVMVVASEVTGQVKAKQLLQASETRFRNLLMQSPVPKGIFLGKDFVIELANEALLRLWEKNAEEINGKKLLDLFPELNAQLFPLLLQKTFSTGKMQKQQGSLWVNSSSGKKLKYILDFVCSPFFEANEKNPSGIIVTAIDVTEQTQSRKKIAEAEQRSRLAIEAAEMGTFEFNLQNREFIFSERLAHIFGFSEAGKMSDADFISRIHPDDKCLRDKAYEESRTTGMLSYEARLNWPDGSERWVRIKGKVSYDESNHPLKIHGTGLDITTQKRVEKELLEAKRISDEIVSVKEQFLANMSHEIRTPMNAIVGFTNLVLKTPLEQEQKKYIDAIKTSGENLLVIINDILDFSRLQAGGIFFEQINFRLSQIMSTFTEMLLPRATEKGIRLSLVIDKDIPDQITGDPTRLNQIMLNLVGNAIKFTEKGEVRTRVRLVSETEDHVTLKFSVTDTGIGIPANKLSSIFDAFTQATSDTIRKYGGSGLGLSIVKQLVEKQGGTISVQSNVGVGSIFSFLLEFGKNLQPDTSSGNLFTSDATEDETIVEGLNVLLVEDNELNQILATKILNAWKWNVEVAENGLIGIEKLNRQDFDIILMDIQLPEMDGYEATRQIRTKFRGEKRNVPIMAMTAHAMPSEEQKCYDVGMNGYISKPFSTKVLYSRILSVINNHRVAPLQIPPRKSVPKK